MRARAERCATRRHAQSQNRREPWCCTFPFCPALKEQPREFSPNERALVLAARPRSRKRTYRHGQFVGEARSQRGHSSGREKPRNGAAEHPARANAGLHRRKKHPPAKEKRALRQPPCIPKGPAPRIGSTRSHAPSGLSLIVRSARYQGRAQFRQHTERRMRAKSRPCQLSGMSVCVHQKRTPAESRAVPGRSSTRRSHRAPWSAAGR